MSKTPVIAFVSPKGGVGKTTAALTLASELIHQTGERISIIDADPNYPFKRWAVLRPKATQSGYYLRRQRRNHSG